MEFNIDSKYVPFTTLEEPSSRFDLGKLIATGTFGEVHEACDKNKDNKAVAVKIIENIRENLADIEEEYLVLKEVSENPYFPDFYGAFLKKAATEADCQIWFVMELCTMGSVSDLARAYIKEGKKKFPEELMSLILKDTIKAVSHLHSLHIVHRDVKGQNILITAEGKIKLVDFGQAGHLNDTMDKRKTAVGTPYWMAPEVIECEQKPEMDYDIRVDTWALGIVMLELAEGQPPYSNMHPVRALFQIIKNPPPTPKIISDWSNEFADFLTECLVKNPEHRPVIAEVIEHPFIEMTPEDDSALRKKLLDEVKRLNSANFKRDNQLLEAVACQGYIKSERRGEAKKIITDDLAALQVFNDDVVVEVLSGRWKDNHIYTWVADILIAVNPYAPKVKYDEDCQVKYKSKGRSDNDPHVFAIADRAHQDMMHNKQHQSIILTGESGSGKTFNSRQLLNQLCYIGCSNPGLIEKIKAVHVIVDAFGNAVTQLNSDATRHCRYFDVTYSKTGKVSGALLWIMMLEKSRVTCRPKGEGNFHMFYYMYDGLAQTSRLANYGLKLGRNDYKCLVKHAYDNEIQNKLNFTKVEEGFKCLGLRDDQIHTIYLMIAAVINLCQVEFEGGSCSEIVDPVPAKWVTRILDIDEKKFMWCLTKTCRMVGGNVVQADKSEDEARKHRDALAQTLYHRVFDYIVNQINHMLSITRMVFGDPNAIGILDMFGFEANDHNTLDNLMVNVANEQVQYYYNQYVFNWEMQDYAEEGIQVKAFTFPDNRHILELFLGKEKGLFAILDEDSKEQGTDASLGLKFDTKLNNKQIQKVSDNVFAISHYVGRVKYDIRGFTEKNRDKLSPEFIETFRKSANENLIEIFKNSLTKTGNLTIEQQQVKKKKAGDLPRQGSRRFNTKSKGKLSQTRNKQTVALNFRYSLIEILFKLTNSQPHFLRCIRSNMDNSADEFDADMVKHQVKYHAICDTIRIRQQGFSNRVNYPEFLRRYQFLAFEFDETVECTKDNCRLLLVRLKMEGWAIGKNKVFLKYYNEEFLSRLYETSVKKIVKVQAMFKSYLMRKRKKAEALKEKAPPKRQMTQDEAATKIQANIRGHLDRQKTLDDNPDHAEKIKNRTKYGEKTIEGEACRIVQYYFRKWKLRTLFQALQIYRADKIQQLVYFSQQVHLYGQEQQAKMKRLNDRIELSIIKNEPPGAHKKMPKPTVAPPKLSLDHSLNAFFDTEFLCDPARQHSRNQVGKSVHKNPDDDWEAPFKDKSPAAAARKKNLGIEEDAAPNKYGGKTYGSNLGGGGAPRVADYSAASAGYDTPGGGVDYTGGMDVKSRMAMFSQGTYSDKPSGYKKYGGAGSYKPAASHNQFIGGGSAKGPAPNIPTQSYLNRPKIPPVVVNSTHNGYGDYADEGATVDFRSGLRKTGGTAALDYERQREEYDDGDGATVNFQGMLRKTGVSRDSMKRGQAHISVGYGGSDIPKFTEESEEEML